MAPPKYKLTYFDAKGIAEMIRFLLAYLEEDFEDIRLSKELWPNIKATTPFGKLPVLEEEDGRPLTQSMAIARYLGRKAGLGGKNDWEDVQIDIIADTITDMRLPIADFIWETDEDIKRTKRDLYVNETLPFYLKRLDLIVEQHRGFLANGKFSWVDIVFTSVSEFLDFATNSKDVTEGYKNLHVIREKVFNLPQIRKWISKRPETAF